MSDDLKGDLMRTIALLDQKGWPQSATFVERAAQRIAALEAQVAELCAAIELLIEQRNEQQCSWSITGLTHQVLPHALALLAKHKEGR